MARNPPTPTPRSLLWRPLPLGGDFGQQNLGWTHLSFRGESVFGVGLKAATLRSAAPIAWEPRTVFASGKSSVDLGRVDRSRGFAAPRGAFQGNNWERKHPRLDTNLYTHRYPLLDTPVSMWHAESLQFPNTFRLARPSSRVHCSAHDRRGVAGRHTDADWKPM